MALLDKKRKTDPTNESFVRTKGVSTDNRPPKRQRKDQDGQGEDSAKSSAVPVLSKSIGGDVVFPRGGGSVLTPLEHKKIHIEATRDVLFEQQQGKTSKTRTAEESSGPSKKQPRARFNDKKTSEIVADEIEPAVRIERLNYKVGES